ncbi:MAG: S-layer homology domain-containing protein [Clostridia bacterium]|nr:S-layer homology domain-containing protein [Clostridia bacterium]
MAYTAASSMIAAVDNLSGAKFNMYGGTLDSTYHSIRNKGTVNISGGTVTSDRDAIQADAGDVTISGTALVTSTGSGWATVNLYGGKFDITGGTITHGNGGLPVNVPASASGSLNISGGSITTSGKKDTVYLTSANVDVTITGGSITNTYGSVSYSSNNNSRYGWAIDVIDVKSLTISGAPVIDSIYLVKDKTITVGQSGLSNTSPIPVYCRSCPAAVTSQNSTDYSKYFTPKESYAGTYTIVNKDNVVWFTRSVTVSYTDGADGTEVFADQSYPTYLGADTPTFVGTPERTGYTFTGWYPAVSDTVTESETYTAQWDANEYTITFNTDGGTEVAPITQDYGAAITAPVNPTKVGYSFDKWEPAIPATMPAGNMTVKALWIEKDDVSIETGTQSYTFDGQAKAFAISGTSLTGFTVEYYVEDDWTTDAPTDAGKYDVRITRDEDGTYKAFNKTLEDALEISPKEITRPEQAEAVTYTGSALTYGVTETADYTVTNGTQTAANENGYTVIISLKDKDNTVWDDGTVTDLTHKFIINRKAIEAVAGVQAPVAAQTAQTTVSGENYSGTVKWNPDVTTFGYYTAYTATVTLTADTNYKFADSITLADYEVSVSNDNKTLTLTRTFDKTAKAKIISITAPTVDKLAVYGTLDDALSVMPGTVVAETEAGRTTLPITWEIVGTYNAVPEQSNTFKWSAGIGDYDANGITLSGNVNVVNADFIGVVNTGTPAEITYDTSTFDVSSMFTPDTNAGTASYEIVVLGTVGEGTATLGEDGKTLTITKAGVITVKMTTEANGAYGEGSASTTLTVNAGVGAAEVTIDSWTYGDTASTPVLTSETNATEGATYLYESTDGKGYSSENAPTNAGAYKVTATLAANDLYAEAECSAEFTVSKATPVVADPPYAKHIAIDSALSESVIEKGRVTGLNGVVLDGKFTWKNPNTIIREDQAQTAVFTPVDENYATTELELNITTFGSTPPDTSSGDTSETKTVKNSDGTTTKITTEPDGTVTEVTEYPGEGTVTVVTEKDGTVITTVEDTEGNIVHITEETDGTVITRTEGSDGTVTTTIEEADGTIVSETEDTDGNVTTVTVTPDGDTTAETIDPEGNKTKVEFTTDGEMTITEERTDGTVITTVAEDEEIVTEVKLVKDADETEIAIPVTTDEDVKITFTDEDGNEVEITDYDVTDDGIVVKVKESGTLRMSRGKKIFLDVHPVDHWATDEVDYVYEAGLMKGVSADYFAPDVSITRAMFTTVLWRMEGEPEVDTDIPFEDVVNGSYYEEAVRWAADAGVVKGVSETAFAPDVEITREQMATMIYRYVQYIGEDTSVGENTNILSYDDFDEISEYAIPAMQYAVGSGLIKGRTESTLDPLDNATRAETAAILERFIKANK